MTFDNVKPLRELADEVGIERKCRTMLQKIQKFFAVNSWVGTDSAGIRLTISQYIVRYNPPLRKYYVLNIVSGIYTTTDYWEDVVRHLHYKEHLSFFSGKYMKWSPPRTRGINKPTYKPLTERSLLQEHPTRMVI